MKIIFYPCLFNFMVDQVSKKNNTSKIESKSTQNLNQIVTTLMVNLFKSGKVGAQINQHKQKIGKLFSCHSLYREWLITM